MSRMIFINLPVSDLKAAMAFYAALGFNNDPHFTGSVIIKNAAGAAC